MGLERNELDSRHTSSLYNKVHMSNGPFIFILLIQRKESRSRGGKKKPKENKKEVRQRNIYEIKWGVVNTRV